MDEKQYLTLKEACAIARISYTKLRALIKSGELKALRPTWKIVIDKADLDAFMRASEVKPKVG